jgi:hydrogenase maturation protease
MSAKILVAGIGNIFLGDDAFGSEVARRLLPRHWPDNVRVTDFGIRGFDLTFALLDSYDVVVLIDATSRGEAPGTLYTIEVDPADVDQPGSSGASIETHGMNPMRALALAQSSGARFRRIFLIGCEPSPGSIDPDGPGEMGMSEPVRNAVDRAADLIEDVVARCAAEAPDAMKHATGGK